MNWDRYFINIAQQVKLRSKDQSTKIGAVIVGPNNEIRSTGYNSFPRGIEDERSDRQERPEKYFWFEHAERNAIYCAARVGTPLDGCRMFLTCWVPCSDCARAIIQVGIIEIILAQPLEEASRIKWIDQAKRSEAMFKEAGVKIRYAD